MLPALSTVWSRRRDKLSPDAGGCQGSLGQRAAVSTPASQNGVGPGYKSERSLNGLRAIVRDRAQIRQQNPLLLVTRQDE
jgi:hypothetical protein